MATPSRNGGILELTRQRVLIGTAVLATVAFGGIAWWARSRPRPADGVLIPGDRPPVVTAEVLNSTSVDGLAREITRRLRRKGVDVLYFGSSGERRNLDTTLILVRRGDSSAAVMVRNALGVGRVRLESDPQRLLDVSVILGRDATLPLDSRP